MMASPVNKDSKRIMHMIEPQTEGAEIGVWAANTSVQFLNRGISRLELIDPYSVEPYKKSKEYPTYEKYLEKYARILHIENNDEDFQKYYDRMYSQVKATVGQDPRAVSYTHLTLPTSHLV